MTIDATDLQYQVSKDFKPDKASTWPYPQEQDGWMLAHNAIRQEISELKDALAALDKRNGIKHAWEVKALQDAANAHFVHIHAHHSNEDNIMTPFVTKRAKYPDKLTSDHDGIVKQLDALEKQIKSLKPGDKIDILLKDFVEYEKDLLPHLAEEEEIGLPLARAYFSPDEIKPAIMEIIKHSPKLEMGSFVHSCGAEFMKNTFMPQEGIPFFVWYIDFYWKHRAFLDEFTYNVQALVEGKERKRAFRIML